MSEMLLAGSTTAIVFGAVGAAAALSLLYGIFKKGSRISWAGWEILLVFLITLAFGAVQGSGVLVFLLTVGVMLAVTVGLCGATSGIKKKLGASSSAGARAFDRVWGAVTSIMNVLVFALGLGGVALYFAGTVGGIGIVLFQTPLWTNFLQKHILDLFLVSLFVGAVHGGYRLGFMKFLFAAAAMFLTGAAFIGSIYLTTRVSFLSAFAGTVAGGFSKLGAGVAALLGGLVVATLCFAVLFAVLVVLMWLLNKPIRKLTQRRAVVVIDGTLLAVLTFIVSVLLVCGAYFGIHFLGQSVGGLFGEAGSALEVYFNALSEAFTSSPFSKILYEYNPLRLMFGG